MKLFSFIKNDIKNHKKLYIIITILAILLALYQNDVFAANSTLTTKVPDFELIAENNGYDLSEYPYYIILDYRDSSSTLDFYAMFSKNPITLCDNPATANTIKIESSGNMLAIFASSETNYNVRGIADWYAVRSSISSILYTNHNIVNSDNKSVVFFAAPLEVGAITLIGTFMTTQQATNLTMKQVVSLIPLLTALVVSFLGLRKALGVLAHFLRKA